MNDAARKDRRGFIAAVSTEVDRQIAVGPAWCLAPQHRPTCDLARQLKRSVRAVYQQAEILGARRLRRVPVRDGLCKGALNLRPSRC